MQTVVGVFLAAGPAPAPAPALARAGQWAGLAVLTTTAATSPANFANTTDIDDTANDKPAPASVDGSGPAAARKAIAAKQWGRALNLTRFAAHLRRRLRGVQVLPDPHRPRGPG